MDKIESINLPFILYFKNIKIPEEIQAKLRNEFLLRLCEMRDIEDKEERLKSLLNQY